MSTAREQLADLLKRARLDAGIGSQEALAEKIKVSRPQISKAESPTQPVPSDALLIAIAGVTGAPQDELLALAKQARGGAPAWFLPYKNAESVATALRCWNPLQVPGLVQTPAYARAVFAVERYPAERLDELVQDRIGRQQVLDRARLTVVLDTPVLARCIGSPQIMADQLARLADMTETMPNVAVHVVGEGQNVGLAGAFNIATRDGITTVNLTQVRDVTSTETRLVEEVNRTWEQVLGASMTVAESVNYLRTWEEKWKAQT
jgi:transcriptional regulator with XRE-family HTH domain